MYPSFVFTRFGFNVSNYKLSVMLWRVVLNNLLHLTCGAVSFSYFALYIGVVLLLEHTETRKYKIWPKSPYVVPVQRIKLWNAFFLKTSWSVLSWIIFSKKEQHGFLAYKLNTLVLCLQAENVSESLDDDNYRRRLATMQFFMLMFCRLAVPGKAVMSSGWWRTHP